MHTVTVPLGAANQLREALHRRGSRYPSVGPASALILATKIEQSEWDFLTPAARLTGLLIDQFGTSDEDLRKAVIAALGLSFPAERPQIALPPSVLARYPAAFRRLARQVLSDDPYGADLFAKDVRFVLGQTVPGGAQDIDIAYRTDARALAGRLKRTGVNALRVALRKDVAASIRLLKASRGAPWLQMHTDPRNLLEFTPDGWDQFYRTAADFLALHPRYAGLVGQSWFFDPAIAQISPRLSYLATRPLGGGGVHVRLGGSALDTELAIQTSPTRRRLYEAGQYRPECWAIYWPRAALLQWAAETRPDLLTSLAA